MNQVKKNTATESETIPARSSVRWLGALDSSMPRTARTVAPTASGACTRNTQLQLLMTTTPAPMTGPKPSPMPKTTPQMPKALARCAESLN